MKLPKNWTEKRAAAVLDSLYTRLNTVLEAECIEDQKWSEVAPILEAYMLFSVQQADRFAHVESRVPEMIAKAFNRDLPEDW